MYFGDYPFAFQCVIDWDVSKPDSYLFGHSCFWVSGIAIGDFSDGNILGVTISQLEHFLKGEGERSHLMLNGHSSSEVLSRVMAGQCSNRNVEVFFNWGENFDSAPTAVLLEESDHQRLIWGKPQDKQLHIVTEVQEIQLPLGEFERVVRMFLEWYGNAEQQRLPRFGQGEAGGFHIP